MDKKYRITFKEDILDNIEITIKKKINGYMLVSSLKAKEQIFTPPAHSFNSEEEIFDWITNKLFKYEIEKIILKK